MVRNAAQLTHIVMYTFLWIYFYPNLSEVSGHYVLGSGRYQDSLGETVAVARGESCWSNVIKLSTNSLFILMKLQFLGQRPIFSLKPPSRTLGT